MADNPYPSWQDDLNGIYDSLQTEHTDISTDRTKAWNYWIAGNLNEAVHYILYAMGDESTWRSVVHTFVLKARNGVGAVCDAFDELLTEADIPEAEVTWEKIVEAWEAAPIEGFGLTISMIDFMRAEIWNEPAIKYYRAR